MIRALSIFVFVPCLISLVSILEARAEMGTISNGHGHKYVCELVAKKCNGEGKVYFQGHLIYEGGLTHEGLPYLPEYHGYGKLHHLGDVDFEGEFRNGKYHGKGEERANGNTYIGNFEDDKYEGYGELRFKNGNTYIGEFSAGLFNGQGVLKHKNGRTQSGLWENNLFIK
ncbi:hypothetical protein N9T26_00195, partial [Alphaproteobacteria bacterium]|nr:hypothetical protein [Alphaproteobacteria bacterium]